MHLLVSSLLCTTCLACGRTFTDITAAAAFVSVPCPGRCTVLPALAAECCLLYRPAGGSPGCDLATRCLLRRTVARPNGRASPTR